MVAHMTFKENMHDDALVVNAINICKSRQHANNQQCEKLKNELEHANKLEPPGLREIKQVDLCKK